MLTVRSIDSNTLARSASVLRSRILARGLGRSVPWLDRVSARVSADVPALEAVLARLDPTLSLRRTLARVVSRHAETHDVTTFILKPNARFGTYRPGSYVTLHLTIDGRPVQRAYSLSSAPSRDGLIAITVKRVPGGVVSNWLSDKLEPGDVLELSAPQGQFILPAEPPRRLIMISAGSGITPVMSMLRHLIARGSTAEITFLHFARTPEDLIFRHEIEHIAASAPNVKIAFCVEDADDSWSGLRGRFTENVVSGMAPEFRTAETFLCGPSGFMRAVMETFERAGADLSKLRFERFNTDFDASAFLKNAQVVRFLRSGVDSIANGPLTILQGAEERGVRVESGCRAGTCGTCRCLKKKGVVVNLATGKESGDGEEMIYPCVSIARGTVEVDL